MIDSRLTVLNLEGSVLSESDVKLIASQMKNLEQLSVMQSSFNDALMEVFCRWHDSNRSLLQVFRLDATEVTINSVKASPPLLGVIAHVMHLQLTERCPLHQSDAWPHMSEAWISGHLWSQVNN